MEEIYVRIVNTYIKFYRNQIEDVDLLNGINYNDISSTNLQMELFNCEMEKYKNSNLNSNTDFTILYNTNYKKKYFITKNNENILTTDSLISALIEVINLENENEDENIKYNIILSSPNFM